MEINGGGLDGWGAHLMSVMYPHMSYMRAFNNATVSLAASGVSLLFAWTVGAKYDGNSESNFQSILEAKSKICS